MLSEIDTRGSATTLVGIDAVDEARTVFAARSDALRSSRKGSPSEEESFFYIAMRISRHKVRAHRGDRRLVIV